MNPKNPKFQAKTMAIICKGKPFMLLFACILAYVSCFFLLVNSSAATDTCPLERLPIDHDLLDRQEIQLKKLENLLENLRETVAKLQLSASECGKSRSVDKTCLQEELGSSLSVEKLNGPDYSDEALKNVKDKDFESSEVEERARERESSVQLTVRRDSDPGRGITVTKYKPSWSERFQFLSAVKLEDEATCINILPYEDYEGLSKYVAVGDERGRVYVFLANGDVLLEFYTLSNSSVSSMLSYMSPEKNESVLVTGHRDGAILVHRVWETTNGVGFAGDEWHFLSMEHLRTLAQPNYDEASNGLKDVDDASSVLILEVHQVGRMRYILGSDVNGRIMVFRENGTLYGTAVSPSRPLAFLKQRLLFLTETGAGSLDLRSMAVRKTECEGLNGSLAKYYVFDVSERSKAYGFTSEGNLIHVVLLGDILNFKCRLRIKRKSEMGGPLAIQAIKGYLLVVNQEKVFVYNISSHYSIRGTVPRPLFFASLDDMKSAFLNSQLLVQGSRKPLIASNREKFVVLGLGGGYVGIYSSNLPVSKADFDTVLWSSPVLLFILFLIAAWQFFSKKRDSLTSSHSDYRFSTAAAGRGASVGTGSGDRTYTDASSTDIRELRETRRPPTRRYASPSSYPAGQPGYAGGAAIAFRSSSGDPGFRTTAELNFRPQNLEPTGLSKRREPLFKNNQVVEDEIQ